MKHIIHSHITYWRGLPLAIVMTGMALIVRPSLASECDAILKNGIYDELNLRTSKELDTTLKSLLSMDLRTLEKTAKEGGKEGRLAASLFGWIELNAGGSTKHKEERLKQLSQSIQSDTQAFLKSAEFLELSKRTVNESIVKAWSDCNNARHVTGWYADDPLSSGRVSVRFIRPGTDGATTIAVTSVTTNNLVLVPQESSGWFGRQLAPAIRAGRRIQFGESISSVFQRADPDKPASIIVSFGGHGVIDLQFPARTNVAVVNPSVTERVVSARVEKAGAKLLGGGDREMDTDPGDVVTTTFTSELEHDEVEVRISAHYTCEEYRGNRTKLGIRLDDKTLFTAPPGMKIVSVEHAGDSSFAKNPSIRGRNHGFVDIKPPKDTYWRTLDFRVDSSAKNDAPAVGFRGVVRFTVKLQKE